MIEGRACRGAGSPPAETPGARPGAWQCPATRIDSAVAPFAATNTVGRGTSLPQDCVKFLSDRDLRV